MRELSISRFVDPNKILYLISADGAIPQILTASDTSSVVFAGHINAVLIILKTNYACIWICSLAHKRSLNFACVGLI